MNHLNPAQVEQLKEIGVHLQQRRQELSIPLEEISAKTLIRLGMLKAIEEGQPDQLPEPVFVQGFIRRYADALGLDGIALAKTFPLSFSVVESDIPIEYLPKPHSRPIPLYISGIILLIAAMGGLFYLLNRPRTIEPVVQKNLPPQPQKTTASPVPSSPAASTPVKAKPTTSQLNLPIQVTVNLQAESWLRVIADGETRFEGILTKGHQQTWTAKKQLTVRAGNAGGVLVSVNRQKPKLLGTLGNTKEVTFQ